MCSCRGPGPTPTTSLRAVALPSAVAKKAPAATRELDATCRVVLLHGKEAFLRDEYTRRLRDALATAHGEIDTTRYDGTTARPADVLDECRSFGLIANHKLVILDAAEAMIQGDARPLFERYAQSPGEGATLVLRADTWRPGKLDKLIEAAGVIVACEPPSTAAAVSWVKRRAPKQHGREIAPDAAERLVDLVGPHLTRLDMELGKLAAAGEGEITAQRVREMVGASRDENLWDIQATLLNAGPEEALRHLRSVLDVSRQPTALVSYAMLDLARKLHGTCRVMKDGGNPGAASRVLKLWGAAGDAVMAAARETQPADALDLLRAAVQADVRSKTGLGEAERSLEMLALKFAGARNR